MGLRFLITTLGIWLIFIWIRQIYRKRKQTEIKQNPSSAVDMVQCKTCGTHLPKPEAIAQDGDFYCSKKHLPENIKDNMD